MTQLAAGRLFYTYEASVVDTTGVSRKRVATDASISIRSLGAVKQREYVMAQNWVFPKIGVENPR